MSDQTSTLYDFDPDLTAAVETETAQAFRKLNYGKLTMQSRLIKWQDKRASEVTPEVFKALAPGERSQEAVITVGVREFKPEFEHDYQRRVPVGGQDWNRIFKPSLYAALSTTEKDLPLAEALKKLVGQYVCVEDVPQTLSKKEKEAGDLVSKYSTCKIVAIYPNADACKAAHAATYKSGTNGSGKSAPQAGEAPAGFTPKEWESSKVDVTDFYRGAYNKAKGSKERRHKAAMDETIGYWWKAELSEVTEEERAGWEKAIAALNIKID